MPQTLPIPVSATTGPLSPPEISNINIIGWVDINRILVTPGEDGVAAVYRFQNAKTILESYIADNDVTGNINLGRKFYLTLAFWVTVKPVLSKDS